MCEIRDAVDMNLCPNPCSMGLWHDRLLLALVVGVATLSIALVLIIAFSA